MIFIFIIIIIIMIKNNKIPCNNVSTETYTGKEQSPKRFGLSAEGFDLNFEKEGYDGKIWIVQIKNNRKVWVRKNIMTKITHEEPLITNDGISEITRDSIGSIGSSIDNDQKSEIIEEKKEEVATVIQPQITVEKKKTDYNIFSKYYLDKLKKEDTNKTPHKILFQQTTQEWARLKNNPTELKILMEQIKK
jgi:hypothetical protein